VGIPHILGNTFSIHSHFIASIGKPECYLQKVVFFVILIAPVFVNMAGKYTVEDGLEIMADSD
jgi:hypothetical protein